MSAADQPPARTPAGRLRAARRALLLLVAGALWYALWLAGWPGAALAGRTERWRGWILMTWARAVCAILGMRVEVDGPLPRPPFLLVSNHLSYVDIVLLASRVPCAFVAKAEVRSWPAIGPLAASMGTLFVDRGRKRDVKRVADLVRARLDAGQGVVLFPEGTSTAGDAVAPFRSSLLEPAALAGVPVRWAALTYATPPGEAPARTAVAWWGDMTLGPHLLHLLRLSHFRARVVFGDPPIRDPDRKSLASRLQREVARRFEPLTRPLTSPPTRPTTHPGAASEPPPSSLPSPSSPSSTEPACPTAAR